MKNPFEYFFGKSQNGPAVDLLIQQAAIAFSCAQVLKESRCRAIEKIIEYERTGDATEEKIHEIIDSAFILRFDKSDITQLTQNLDNLVDAMRHVATHVDTFAPHLKALRPEVDQLLESIVDMTRIVSELVPLLKERRIALADIKRHVRMLSKAEAKADSILHHAEVALVREHTTEGHAIAFLAHDGLVKMLEEVTDVANHCGTIILSIARKEA